MRDRVPSTKRKIITTSVGDFPGSSSPQLPQLVPLMPVKLQAKLIDNVLKHVVQIFELPTLAFYFTGF